VDYGHGLLNNIAALQTEEFEVKTQNAWVGTQRRAIVAFPSRGAVAVKECAARPKALDTRDVPSVY